VSDQELAQESVPMSVAASPVNGRRVRESPDNGSMGPRNTDQKEVLAAASDVNLAEGTALVSVME
jgi:hypothetical protein